MANHVAFLGLGAMGAPMAARLLDAGHQLTVWNRTPAKAGPLVARGARLAGSPASAAADADVVITMLADPAALDAVVWGTDGIAGALRAGRPLIEMSTVGPGAVRALAERVGAAGGILDAPVNGSVDAATGGTLAILVGGAEEDFRRWRPVLAMLGEPTYVGPLGSGAAAKVVRNAATVTLVALLGEALALADSLGVPQAVALAGLRASPLAGLVDRIAPLLDEPARGPADFRLALAGKDLDLALTGRESPIIAAARGHYRDAAGSGLGDQDMTAVVDHVRRR